MLILFVPLPFYSSSQDLLKGVKEILTRGSTLPLLTIQLCVVSSQDGNSIATSAVGKTQEGRTSNEAIDTSGLFHSSGKFRTGLSVSSGNNRKSKISENECTYKYATDHTTPWYLLLLTTTYIFSL